MAKEPRVRLLQSLDSRTKVLGLIVLIIEVFLVGALYRLPEGQVLYAIFACVVVLIVALYAIVRIETVHNVGKSANFPELKPTPLTPDSPPLKDIIDSAIHTMCRAVSLPDAPEDAKLRVFIFRKERNQLICSHHWAQNPVTEVVDQLRFDINHEVAQKVAVVRAVIDGAITRTEVQPLPQNFKGVEGKVSEELSYVLAAPIYKNDGNVWGTIDFDAGNDIGKKLLATKMSDATMFQLSQHLRVILSLPEAHLEDVA